MAEKTKKAWAGNVISSSFYARVEKGLNRISAEDLIDLLYFIIKELFYEREKDKLAKLYEIISKSYLPNKDDYLLLIKIYLSNIKGDELSIGNKDIQKIKGCILSMNSLEFETLGLYYNFMFIYNLDDNIDIGKYAIALFANNNSIAIKKIILGIKINILFAYINEKKYEKAIFFLTVLKI
ncbi:hypothetical protein [Lactobacillus sp. ESL0225]|uniref:hypothetical protein n=1 Tax=Lactobacillus sp. ESL0225 TaxID=2069351 RepID=UPI000F1612F5|nr:hypothetical protein [Lactobacillus sp. ESL0225]RMC51181.1 hypothetical protein F5ESL0225_02185 [Lactobacillus sp. ESL0225]